MKKSGEPGITYPGLFAFAVLIAIAVGCGSEPSTVYRFDFAFGSKGGGPGELKAPIGVAVDKNGNVYVTEAENDRIQKFDSKGKSLAVFSPVNQADNPVFDIPMHLTLAAGNLYVADYGRDRVIVLDKNGRVLREFGDDTGPGALDAPGGVAVAADGTVYVADFYHHRIATFYKNGKFQKSWGEKGRMQLGEFTYPTDVAMIPDDRDSASGASGAAASGRGRIAVADGYGHRIQVFDTSGKGQFEMGGRVLSTHPFNVAAAVTADPASGRIFAADQFNHKIHVYDRNGLFLGEFGAKGTGDGHMDRPAGVSVAPSGAGHAGCVYVSDYGNHRILRFCPGR